MPQPFKRKGRAIRLSPATVVEKPHLAIGVASIASHWANLESTLALMYTYMLFGQEPSAFEFYHNLIDLNLRKQAFMDAAKGKLSGELIKQIESLYVDVRKLARARNKVIHATWATTPTLPDSILLAQPKDVNAKVNEVFQHLVRMRKNPHPQKVTVDLTPEMYMRYDLKDFNNIAASIIALDNLAMKLANQVLARVLELASKLPAP